MYQILCDEYPIYDPRDDDLIVTNPKCKLAVNTVGEASFSIYSKHPYYGKLQKLKSVFEILQDGETIFRGRMTEDSIDFDNKKDIDLEGAMAYFNDSIIRPFVFPDNFTSHSGYIAASGEGGNVVTFFLGWLIDQHNSQVDDFQQFKLGRVTVADKNNYISRASEDYSSTWELLSSKLFNSSLGGYLCIRYEPDGNYIDYLNDFDLTNTQRIEYGENLLDISTESDATSTYSAIIPQGAKISDIDKDSDDDSRLTIMGLADGNITEDLVIQDDMIYSISARQRYGWICCPPKETTWDDITTAEGLRDKSIEYMTNTATKLKNKISITALDLHFSDEEIEAFRIYRYCRVLSKPHNHEDSYKLTQLDIDLFNPQNTKITLGEETMSLTDINASNKQNVSEKVESIKIQTTTQNTDFTEAIGSSMAQMTEMVNTSESILLAALDSYVETADLESYKEVIQSQLKLLSDEMVVKFTEVSSSIKNVDGDLQEKFNTITKYFTFNINGLTIGQTDNPYKVVIDNDRYSMLVNDVEVLWIANGKVNTPEIAVTSKMDMFGYLIKPDDQGNINCEYIGGEV